MGPEKIQGNPEKRSSGGNTAICDVRFGVVCKVTGGVGLRRLRVCGASWRHCGRRVRYTEEYFKRERHSHHGSSRGWHLVGCYEALRSEKLELMEISSIHTAERVRFVLSGGWVRGETNR